jgi:hypothetical protein
MLRRIDAGQTGHVDIQETNIRLVSIKQADRFASVARLGND